MFKKHKEKKEAAQQALAQQYAQAEQAFEDRLLKAEALEDGGAALLEMEAVAKEARIAANVLEWQDEKKAGDVNAYTGLSGLGAAGIVATVGTILFPPVALAAIPVGAVGLASGAFGGKSVSRKLEARDAEHIANFRTIADLAYEAMDSRIARDVKGISQSPHYEEVLKSTYIAKAFSVAAAKQVVADQQALEEAAKASAAEKPEGEKPAAPAAPVETAPHEKQDFTRFTQFGRTTKKPPQP